MGKKRTKFAANIYVISLLPLILLAVILLIAGYPLVQNALVAEAEQDLQDTAVLTESLLGTVWPGDYRLEGEEALYLYKGETDITFDYAMIDAIKAKTGLDISVIYRDTRILTTVTDKSGVRAIATGVAEPILKQVQGGESVFYHNVKIYDTEYFAYYTPLKNSDGSMAGLLAVAKPASQVQSEIRQVLLPFFLIDLVLMFVAVFVVFGYTRHFSSALSSLYSFLEKAADGESDVEMDPAVLERHDEFSQIGTSVLNMHRSLRNVMERDPLTQLFNRRSADRKMKLIMNREHGEETDFCISIGDIDFFKKVNDTYGHDAGDLVLKEVANAIQEHMLSLGFTARWGGEEFLLVFDRSKLEAAAESLTELLSRIRRLEIRYGEQLIPVTMTFGVSEWDPGMTLDDLIRSADRKLYYGKENGRNRVVVHLDPEQEESIPEEEPEHGSRLEARAQS